MFDINFITQDESEYFERKEWLDEKYANKLPKAIWALANNLSGRQEPGYLVIGVRDADGQLSGVTFNDEQIRQVTELRSSGKIQPLPCYTVEKFCHPDGEALIIQVTPSDAPPVRYDGLTTPQDCLR